MWAVVLAALLPLLSDCGGEQPRSPSTEGRPGKATSSPTCPSAGPGERWPTGVPATLPRLPGLKVTERRRQGDVLVVRFTVPLSLSRAGELVVTDLPRAGFALRDGDAEGDEIDQQFAAPGYRGALKLTGVATCRTAGTLVGTRTR